MLRSSFHELVSLTSQVFRRSQEGVICKIIGNLPRAAPLIMSPSPSNHSGLMYTQAGVRSQERLPPLQWDEEKPKVQILTAAENSRAQHSSSQHSSFLNNTPRSPHTACFPHTPRFPQQRSTLPSHFTLCSTLSSRATLSSTLHALLSTPRSLQHSTLSSALHALLSTPRSPHAACSPHTPRFPHTHFLLPPSHHGVS